jgi:hypothetical protein
LLIVTIILTTLNAKPPSVKAISTVGTSSNSTPNPNASQRSMVRSTNGTIVDVYQAGSQAPNDLSYSKSTDNGTTWSASTQIDTTTSRDFTIAIDSSDNIYVSWADTGAVKIRKMTYSAGSWSIGSANTIVSAATCVNTTTDGHSYSRVSLALPSSGTVWVSALDAFQTKTGCPAATNVVATNSSASLTSWTANAATITASSGAYPTMLQRGQEIWMEVSAVGLYVDRTGSGVFTKVDSTSLNGPVSMAYGLDEIHMFYSSGSTLLYRKFVLSTQTLSSTTTISASASDVLGTISTDSYNIWVFYQAFVGANSYNVTYKEYTGASWGSAVGITSDNANNTNINAPDRISNTVSVPTVWNTGTASPFTIKASNTSSIGGATDSGNQTGSYSGSLTGISTDVIVKSGVWYYSSVNIVSSMQVKVLASDGQTGGSLTIYSTTVTIAGTLDGAGRGSPGAVSFISSGLGGAGAPGPGDNQGANGTAGTTTPTSLDGATGTGSFAGVGGTRGARGAGGAGGVFTNSCSGPGAGGAGGGNTGTAGTGGSNGGYNIVGANGDSSTDDTSVNLGSGGGSGGTGGPGGGGGAGSGGAVCGGVNTGGGSGGAGGAGKDGGLGSAGGDGGAAVKIYSAGSMTISGSINVTGNPGGSVNTGTTGLNGSAGGAGFGGTPAGGSAGTGGASDTNGGNGGTGGYTTGVGGGGSGGGGGGGGGSSGGGGNGAGGGVILENTQGFMTISGTIDNRGGGSATANGGTVKIFYVGTTPSTSGISRGRLFIQNNDQAPNVPTLTSPSNGAAVLNTTNPVLHMNSTDPQTQEYLRFKVLIYKTSATSGGNCSGSLLETGDETSSQTGWSGQDTQSSTAYNQGTDAVYTMQTNIAGIGVNSFCWQARAIDPNGLNAFSASSSAFTFTTQYTPSVPTLIDPPSSASAITRTPLLRFRSYDPDADYIKYAMKLYTNNTDCTNDTGSNLTISADQTSSQTNWIFQDANSGNAYSGGIDIGHSTIAVYQVPYSSILGVNTGYFWKARAIDPAGTNAWSSWSSCQTFTTATIEVQLQGGTTILGGTTVQ